ncbi:MAG: hypothetical protein LAP85_29500 [Acidobacteriia bacterium]|nr:hypothetical protein [Terriglobia bacterium]
MPKRISPSDTANYIDRFFPDIVKKKQTLSWDHAGHLQAISEMIDSLHESQLPADPGDRTILLVASRQILTTVRCWESGNRATGLPEIPGLRDKSPVAVIRELLDKCTETIIPNALAGLDFIKDPDYRQILREDLAGFESDLDNREWKSAGVMGGSLIEALLLDALNKVAPSACRSKCSEGQRESSTTDGLESKGVYRYSRRTEDYHSRNCPAC